MLHERGSPTGLALNGGTVSAVQQCAIASGGDSMSLLNKLNWRSRGSCERLDASLVGALLKASTTAIRSSFPGVYSMTKGYFRISFNNFSILGLSWLIDYL